MRTHTTISLLAFACLLGLSGEVFAQRGNRGGRGNRDSGSSSKLNIADIHLHSGRAYENVKIDDYTFKEIVYREKGRRKATVKGEDVAEIRFRYAPASFNTGLSQVRAGLYDRAVSSFTTARTQAKDGTWVKVYATYWLGETNRLMGTSEALSTAVDEFKRVVDNAGDHYMAPAAIYGLGLAQAASGQGSAAIATFKKLDADFGDLWRLQGKVGEGNAYLDQKDAGKARQSFEIANQSASRYPSVRREAQVGIGKAYVMDKRFDDAVRFFDEIIAQPGVENVVAGGAWLGKGDCRYEQARASGNDENSLKEALIAYQTCVVRYAGVPNVYPKALYMSSMLYKKLGLKDLSSRMEEELRSRCPSSKWTARLKND
ncbi:MAG: tetratricopeptide repeat protein [Planctomycetota bacterium]|jgi:tetratricopeptide (TPR) repeat protein